MHTRLVQGKAKIEPSAWITEMFIAIEGMDGVGKTTQARLLYEALSMEEMEVVLTKDPGGTYVSEKIREIVLHQPIDSVAKLLLFGAARLVNVTDVIEPSLSEGCVVISDRYTPSTIAYQQYGVGLPEWLVKAVNAISSKGIYPDLVFYLRVPVEICLERMGGRDEFEKLGEEFYRRVWEGYEELAEGMIVIDGTQSIVTVHKEILGRVKTYVTSSRRVLPAPHHLHEINRR